MRIEARIGQGGMGEVWRGHHIELDVPIALKVLRTPDPRHRAAFFNEIRSISTLSHPHIIQIVEQGQIDAPIGPLQPGNPYLAMALADGTISPRCGQMSWSDIQGLLLNLLSALAHAHARGLLHGDLKPSNVLLVDETVRLSDFGLARRLGRRPEASASMGTPRYMAPEQVLSRWREAGPWTDLFSFGRLAEALIFGKAGGSQSHRLTPGLPEGFLGWLSRLLAPSPSERFQRAADAAHALTLLPVPRAPEQRPDTAALSRVEQTFSLTEPSQEPRAEETWLSGLSDEPVLEAPPSAELAPRPRPPLPTTWRTKDRPPEAGRYGLSLLGLRSPPTIGREREQQMLWECLEAVSEGALRVCVIGGVAGTGKRRLANWLSERAHEVGAVTVLAARHTERSSDALSRMLAHSFHCVGLQPEAISRHIESQLRKLGETDTYEWQALSEMIAPTGASHRMQSSVRFALLQRHLERVIQQQRRPVILRLEDTQWSSDALGFTMHLLRARNPPPVLVLVTWAPAPDRPLNSRAIRALLRRPEVVDLQLDPLPTEQMYQLAHSGLGLAPEPAAVVAQHAQGSPLFAVHIVQLWAQEQVLQLTPEGLARRPGGSLRTPESLDALWLARLDRCLRDLPSGQSLVKRQASVELASLLDGPIDHGEWTEACGRANIKPEMAVVESLLASGLARSPTRDPQAGWSLAHWTFREAIEQRAGVVGRMPALHRACAWLLAERDAPTMALRLARHLLDAGEDAAALEPLLIAAKQLSQNGAYRKGNEVLAVREAAIERLELADDAPERMRGLRMATHFAQLTRNFDRAEVLIQDMLSRSTQPADRALALQQLCRLRRNRGQLMEAHALNQQALQLAKDLQRPLLIAHSHRERGSILILEGAYDRAEAAFQTALLNYEQTSDDRSRARTLSGLGRLCNRTRRWGEAIQYIEDARQIYSRLKDRLSEIACLNDLGEAARFSARYEEAESHYRSALDALRNTGHIAESITEINLALIWVAQGRFAEAEQVLATEQFRHEEAGQHGTAGLLYAYRLPGLVSLGQWALAAATAQQAQDAAESINLRDADAARLAAQASRIAAAAGRAPLAEALHALSSWHKP